MEENNDSGQNPPKKKISRDSLRRSWGLYKYIRPYRFWFWLGVMLLLFSSSFTLIITRLLGQLAGLGVNDNSITQELEGQMNTGYLNQIISFDFAIDSIQTVVVILFVLLIIQGVVSFLRVYVFSYVTENAMRSLRNDTYQKIICMPMQFFNERRVGDLNSRLSSDITLIQETLTWTLAEIIRQLVVIVFGIAMLVSYSPKLTLVMLCSLPVIMVAAVVFGRFIRKLSKQTQDKVAESNVIVSETLTGIVNVKSFTNEMFEVLRYGKSISDVRNLAMRGARWRGMFATFIIVFAFGALALVIWQGALLMQSGELPSELFFTFLLLTGLVAGSIGGIASQIGSVQRSIGSIENVLDILGYEAEPVRMIEEETSVPIRGDVQFDSVTFHYASRSDVTVLSNVSFHANSGQTVALVGPSGSGKSTMASLIQQFYVPVSGQILFDGKPAKDYDLTALRNQMAFVPQEVILFGGTIRENIAYGKPSASEDEIREAARKANALDFIEIFPQKFETIVGERGIQLSGGQRQRIAIARAVLRNPTILILDEATSSLDSESERQVQEALDNLMRNRTSIVIAHRLSTIRNADKILVLEKGKIIEEGRHDELMSREGGLYKRLSELQYRNEVESSEV
ncbi:MAG: ABC transporter transmembrane domain-containing protein [Flavobacteriales bacterium]|nr:ABC transporter transmembrane domain-containing protein [Flavobacteriales bacterium]